MKKGGRAIDDTGKRFGMLTAIRDVGSKNNRRLVLLTWNGKTAFASDWARELGISVRTILSRKRYGWSDERTLSTPVGGAK